MPHVVLEYTATLPSALVASVLAQAHDITGSTPTIDPGAVKSRAYPSTFFHIGQHHGSATYLHLAVSILAGRPEDIRTTLADRLFAMLKDSVATHQVQQCSLSAEIREMDALTYRK
jgi:5-carboxymethyl-2-hydroxymuconate isomerase